MTTTTISTSSSAPDRQTPPELVDLAQSKYDFRYLAFPSDLGMDYAGHYMVININEPVGYNEQFSSKFSNQFTGTPERRASKVDTLRGTTNVRTPIGVAAAQATNSANALFIPRFTRRIVESIALYMPTPMVFSHQNEYQEVSLTALGGSIVGGLGARAAGGLMGGLSSAAGGGVTAGLAIGAVNSALGSIVGGAAKIMQRPINPSVEVLFANTNLRSFVFEVLMAPRNEYESATIKSIVKTLKFHGAPEHAAGTGGLLWVPPAEFDITFFNKGIENMNILRINTCVLERFEIDYAPTGIYSTFRSGHPVAVRLSMAFRELEPVHRERVLQGF